MQLVDLYKLVNSIKRCFPNLEFLSLIGNPLCPTFSSSFTPSGAEITRNQRLQLPDGGAAHRPPGSYTTTSVVVDGRHLFDLNSSNNNNTTTDLSCSLALADGKQTEFNYQKYRLVQGRTLKKNTHTNTHAQLRRLAEKCVK